MAVNSVLLLLVGGMVWLNGCKTRKPLSTVTTELEQQLAENKTYTEGEPVFEPVHKTGRQKRHFTWADSVLSTLSLDEKIGQLFMIAAYSNKDKGHVDEVKRIISTYHVGGLIFMQGGPLRQANLCNQYQQLSKLPLMITIDGEWGLSMRLDSTPRFPRQQLLGAIQNNLLVYEMGEEVARQCSLMGIHVNFAPVLDVNSNPSNPVIGNRSFGEDKINVTLKGLAYLRGMQDNGTLACGKHFPGHGDTETDSHLDLPVLKHGYERLDTLELFPFRELVDNGLGSMMVAHLFVPSLDSTPNQPSSLSKRIITDLLQNQLKFHGLVFTDALNMQGVAKQHTAPYINLHALKAGTDILLFAESVGESINAIKAAIDSGEISVDDIDKRVRKILRAKEWMGLNKPQPIRTDSLYEQLHLPQAEWLNRRLISEGITLVQNQQGLLPLMHLDSLRIASVCIGDTVPTPFQDMLQHYAEVKTFNLPHSCSPALRDSLIRQVQAYNLVVISLQNTTQKVSNGFGITAADVALADTLAMMRPAVLSVFANAYALNNFRRPQLYRSIIMPYEQSELAQQYAAMGIMGGIGFKGKLPVSAGGFAVETGLATSSTRLRYGMPEEAGISSLSLKKADSLCREAVEMGATPGGQVWAARNGVVFYHKSFGTLRYNDPQRVNAFTRYDLASLTKVAATLPFTLYGTELGLISPQSRLGEYLPRLHHTNKDSLKILDILTHRSGLKPFIQNSNLVVKDGKWDNTLADTVLRQPTDIEVARKMFVSASVKDSIWQRIDASPLPTVGKYTYSDLGPMYLKEAVESASQTSMETWLNETLYRPLGLWTLNYLPLKHTTVQNIAPTEQDVAFRKQEICGYVHDPTASLLGGVAGHAGLFGTANDVGKLFQVFLQKGYYAGKSYFYSATIDTFTTCTFCSEGNRRGWLFDKPDPDPQKDDAAAPSASPSSFGHSGFTGTLAWVDPAENLVFVFLSNRVHPSAENKKLVQANIRTRLHQAMYESIIKP